MYKKITATILALAFFVQGLALAHNNPDSFAPKWMPSFLKNTKADISLTNDEIRVSTFMPYFIINKETSKFLVFTDLSYVHTNRTLNAGLGFRNMFDKNTMVGLNAFLDAQFVVKNDLNNPQEQNKGTHRRLGLGLECFYKNYEWMFNMYYPLSNPVLVFEDDNKKTWEYVLPGYDFKFNANVTPYFKVGVTHYNFGKVDQIGLLAKAEIQVVPNMSVNASCDLMQQGRVSLGFALDLLKAKPSLFPRKHTERENLNYKLTQSVDRNRNILVDRFNEAKEQKVAFSVHLKDIYGNGLSGLIVNLTDQGGAIIATQTTDTNGNVSFSNITDMDYSIDFTDKSQVYSNCYITAPKGSLNGQALNQTMTVKTACSKEIELKYVDENDQPIANNEIKTIALKFNGKTFSKSTTTDKPNNAIFDNLPVEGKYEIWLDNDNVGYAQVTVAMTKDTVKIVKIPNLFKPRRNK